MKLTYPGKVAANQVIRRTPSALLRPVKAVGEVDWDNWHNRMIVGDNRPVLKTLLKHKQEGILRNEDGSPGVRLVYIDPPFGTGDVYDRDRVGIYSARLRGPEYLEWLRTRMILLKDLMSDDGSLYARTDYHFGHYVKVLLDELFGQENFRNEIIVNRTKKVFDGIHRFNTATDSLYFYSRGKECLFKGYTRPRTKRKWIPMHSPGVRWTTVSDSYLPFYSQDQLRSRPDGAFASRGRVFKKEIWWPPDGRHWTFSQDRLERYAREGRIRISPSGKVLEYRTSDREILDSNWTDIPGFSFKWNFPSENSEALLERVIGASSKPGDVVLDAFAGSGTTAAVAEKMGRRWIMIDSSRASTYTVFRRMLHLKGGNHNQGKPITPSPFVVYRARPESPSGSWSGQNIPVRVYEKVASELIGFKLRAFSENGTEFSGKWRGTPVLVLSAKSGRVRVQEIRERLGGHSRRILLVIPEGVDSILEDVVMVDGTEFHVVRIPHSVEVDLASNGLSAGRSWDSRNPKDLKKIVGAARLEVNLPPLVSCRYRLESGNSGGDLQAVLHIQNFESQVTGRTGNAGPDALGMVAVDGAPNGQVFQPDYVWSREDVVREHYELRFPAAKIDGTIMTLFADRYGNERKEIKRVEDFEPA